MRRAFTATLPRLASFHPMPLLHPGFPPLPPGIVKAPRFFEPIDIVYNTDGVIELLKDADGRVLGKRYWPPGTKEIHLIEPGPDRLQLEPELQEEEDTKTIAAYGEEKRREKEVSRAARAAKKDWRVEGKKAAGGEPRASFPSDGEMMDDRLMRMAESQADVVGGNGNGKGAKSKKGTQRRGSAGRKQ